MTGRLNLLSLASYLGTIHSPMEAATPTAMIDTGKQIYWMGLAVLVLWVALIIWLTRDLWTVVVVAANINSEGLSVRQANFSSSGGKSTAMPLRFDKRGRIAGRRMTIPQLAAISIGSSTRHHHLQRISSGSHSSIDTISHISRHQRVSLPLQHHFDQDGF